MGLHTHRGSLSPGDFCHPAVNHYPSRAVLFEISDLFCSPGGVYCRQHSLGQCLDCVLTGSQLALVQSPRYGALHGRAFVLLGKREQLPLPSAGGNGQFQGHRVSRKQPGEFPLGDNEVMWMWYLQERGFRTEKQSGHWGWCKERPCLE